MSRYLFQTLVATILLFGAGNHQVWGVDDAEQTEALVNLFNNTNGAEWFNNDQWIDGPVCGWYGVRCCEGPFCPGGIYVLDLKLEANNLSGPLPSDFGGLKFLEWILLHDNRLTGEIPPSIGEISGAYILGLNNNELSGPIPPEIGNLDLMVSLTLSDNHLTGEVPAEIWELRSLETLWIQNNRLEGNPLEDIEGGGRLSSPWMQGNRFSGQIPRKVMKMLGRVRLWINFNAFDSNDPEILESLAGSYDPNWHSTQTLAPDSVELTEIDSTTLRLSWSGGGPQNLEGHTIIEHSLSGAGWTTIGETSDRDTTTFDIGRPTDSSSHHYRLGTVTDPHEHNQNTVISDPSDIVTFNPAGHWVLPAVAHLQGAGAFFSSTLHAFNPGPADLEMELVFTPRSDIGGDTRTATWILSTGQAETIDDALEHFFGPWGDEGAVGSLLISVTSGSSEDLLLSSVITARHDTGEEYGQFFPASTFSRSLQAGKIAHIHTTVDTDHSRVNAGLTALEPGTEAELRLVDPIGTPLSDGVHLFEGEAGASTQLNDVWQIFGIDPVADALVEIDVHQGSLIAYGSVLDGHGDYEGTCDPTTVAPFTEGREIVTLLEMGDIIGHDEFSGSASVSNTADQPITVKAEFHQRGWPGVAAETEFDLEAGETRGFPNIVRDLFGLEGVVGMITLETNANALVASGREFAIHRDDLGEIIGTSGQLIRGLITADLLWPGERNHLIGLRQDELPKGHRANVAAFNPAGAEVTITLELFDQASSESEGSTEITVRGQELIHINAIIAEINPDHDETEKRLVIIVSGPVYLQAFRVNPWGDPVTLEAMEG